MFGAGLIERVIPEVVASGIGESWKVAHIKRYVRRHEYLTVSGGQNRL
jgi:hypothetical protein